MSRKSEAVSKEPKRKHAGGTVPGSAMHVGKTVDPAQHEGPNKKCDASTPSNGLSRAGNHKTCRLTLHGEEHHVNSEQIASLIRAAASLDFERAYNMRFTDNGKLRPLQEVCDNFAAAWPDLKKRVPLYAGVSSAAGRRAAELALLATMVRWTGHPVQIVLDVGIYSWLGRRLGDLLMHKIYTSHGNLRRTRVNNAMHGKVEAAIPLEQRLDCAELLDLRAVKSGAGGPFVSTEQVARGKREGVVLYFSASWCAPCCKFTPVLVEYYERLGHKDLSVIFMSLDKTPESFKKYCEKMPWYAMPWNIKKADKVFSDLDLTFLPSLVHVSCDGTVRGQLSQSEIKNALSLLPQVGDGGSAWERLWRRLKL